MMELELSLQEYTAALASAEGAPGCGAAAALAGALGISLGAMSAGCTPEREESGVLAALGAETQALRTDFLNVAECDSETCRTYEMMRARAKADPACAPMAEAGRMAVAQPPMTTMRFACRSIALLERLAKYSGKDLAANVAAAAALERAALSAAAAALRANAAEMSDEATARLLLEEAQMRLDQYLPRADALYRGAWEMMGRDGEDI